MTGGPVDAARRFVDAVAWGEHQRVWDLMAVRGRSLVLEIAGRRGMDAGLVRVLSAGSADPAERSAFLVDLVKGLRTDLGGTDLDRVEFETGAGAPDISPVDDGHAFVTVLEPSGAGLAALGGRALPVATVELVQAPEGWRVVRLVPQRRT